jgi:streptogramin lyase
MTAPNLLISSTSGNVVFPTSTGGTYCVVTSPSAVIVVPSDSFRPLITGVSPIGSYLSGNQYTVVTGQGFLAVTGVSFGSVAAQYFYAISDTELHCSPQPVASAQTVQLTLTTPYGSSSVAYSFSSVIIAGVQQIFTQGGGIGYSRICSGPDGRLWWPDQANHLWAMTPAGVAQSFALPGSNEWGEIIAGSGGKLWTTDWGVTPNIIIKATIAGAISSASLPGSSPTSQPVYGQCVGPNGNFYCPSQFVSGGTLETSPAILYQVTDGLGVEAFTGLAATPGLYQIVSAPDGTMYGADVAGGKLVQVSTAGAILNTWTLWTPYNQGGGNFVISMCMGPDGNLWALDFDARGVWKIVLSNPSSPTFYVIAAASSHGLRRICAGPDGNLYATDVTTAQIIQITTAGVSTAFPISTATGLFGICVGADGALYAAAAMTGSPFTGYIVRLS